MLGRRVGGRRTVHGYGPGLSGTNWAIQQNLNLPSVSFTPHTYTGFSAGVLPNITIQCEGLSNNYINPWIVGDSIAQGYGSIDSFLGKYGLGGPWGESWETAVKRYIPVQLAWQGLSSIEIRHLFTALRTELGAPPAVFLEGATINNWNAGKASVTRRGRTFRTSRRISRISDPSRTAFGLDSAGTRSTPRDAGRCGRVTTPSSRSTPPRDCSATRRRTSWIRARCCTCLGSPPTGAPKRHGLAPVLDGQLRGATSFLDALT